MIPHAPSSGRLRRREFLRFAGSASAFAASGLLGLPQRSTAAPAGLGDNLDLSQWIQPVPPEAVFEDPEFCIWCGSMVQGDDGRYHLFYARWPRRLGHKAWVTHSEVARAVADAPTGPYRHVEVVLPARGEPFWDGSCTHNPTILRVGRRYCLYYMGNHGDGIVRQPLNWIHRNHQRIGVAMADSPEGPWTRLDHPVVDISPEPEAPDALMTSNPATCIRPDGGLLMVYKAVAKKGKPPFGGPVVHLAATADRPDGPFTKHLAPLFTRPGEHFAAEDPYIWHDGGRYRAIVKDVNGIFAGRRNSLAQFESFDGLSWQLARHPFVTVPVLTRTDGSQTRLDALERPQLWRDARGEPAVLFCAGAQFPDRVASFHVAIPLRRPQ